MSLTRYTIRPYPSDRPSRLHIWDPAGEGWVLGPDPDLARGNSQARSERELAKLAAVDPLTALLSKEGIT